MGKFGRLKSARRKEKRARQRMKTTVVRGNAREPYLSSGDYKKYTNNMRSKENIVEEDVWFKSLNTDYKFKREGDGYFTLEEIRGIDSIVSKLIESDRKEDGKYSVFYNGSDIGINIVEVKREEGKEFYVVKLEK
jgi:hypothetical protein